MSYVLLKTQDDKILLSQDGTKGLQIDDSTIVRDKYVTLDTDQTITGFKTFNAPINDSTKSEQSSIKINTSTGGVIEVGKYHNNTALKLQSTKSLINIQASDFIKNTIMWEQPVDNPELRFVFGADRGIIVNMPTDKSGIIATREWTGDNYLDFSDGAFIYKGEFKTLKELWSLTQIKKGYVYKVKGKDLTFAENTTWVCIQDIPKDAIINEFNYLDYWRYLNGNLSFYVKSPETTVDNTIPRYKYGDKGEKNIINSNVTIDDKDHLIANKLSIKNGTNLQILTADGSLSTVEAQEKTGDREYNISKGADTSLFVNVPWVNTWQKNTKDQEGYVLAGQNHFNEVWRTDKMGNPKWATINDLLPTLELIKQGSTNTSAFVSEVSVNNHSITVTKTDLPTTPDINITNTNEDINSYIYNVTANGHDLTLHTQAIPAITINNITSQTAGTGGVYVVDSLSSTENSHQINVNYKQITAESLGINKVYQYKGTLTWEELMNLESAAIGDIYNITTGAPGEIQDANWACIKGFTSKIDPNNYAQYWDSLGGSIDLSNYVEKPEKAILNGIATFADATGKKLKSELSIKNKQVFGPLDWESKTKDATLIPTINTIAYWNGALSGSYSNLKYSKNGEILGSNNLDFTATGIDLPVERDVAGNLYVHIKGGDVDLDKYVTLDTDQTITGFKTFDAPKNIANTEQATVWFNTANGGRIGFGKETPNNGSAIFFEHAKGIRRLNFRSTDTAGSIVWAQPESNSSLYFDVNNIYFRSNQITMSKAGFYPNTNNNKTLGLNGYRWSTGYINTLYSKTKISTPVIEFTENGQYSPRLKNNGSTLVIETDKKHIQVQNTVSQNVNTYTFPDKDGTIALITDLPTVSDATITIEQPGNTDQTFTLNGAAKTITLKNDNTTYLAGGGLTLAAGNEFTVNTSGNQNDETKTYPVTLDTSGNLVVNVPWVDTPNTNTWRPIYSNGESRLSTTGGTRFNLNDGTNTTIRYEQGGNFYIDAVDTWKENTVDSEGYVASGKNQINQVWKTDNNGVPGWRPDANTWKANTDSQEGYVAAGGANHKNQVWRTNENGVPQWGDLKNIDNNFVTLNTDQTITGQKTFNCNDRPGIVNYGTAANSGIITRGIHGSDGKGNKGDLYLNTGTEFNTYFGTEFNYMLGYDGTIVAQSFKISNGTSQQILLGNGTTHKLPSNAREAKCYIVQKDNKDLYVNVPWTDTNTWQQNTATQNGYVLASNRQANCVWGTDNTGNPKWIQTNLTEKYLPLTGCPKPTEKEAPLMTGPIWFKNCEGIKINSTNKDVKIWEVVDNANYESKYGFYELYNGAGEGNNNSLKLYADNQTGIDQLVREIKQDGTVYYKTSNNFNNNITISKATSADMNFSSTNPSITFSENGSQPVKILYTDYDNYRAPAGLKILGGTSASPAWLETEGVNIAQKYEIKDKVTMEYNSTDDCLEFIFK